MNHVMVPPQAKSKRLEVLELHPMHKQIAQQHSKKRRSTTGEIPVVQKHQLCMAYSEVNAAGNLLYNPLRPVSTRHAPLSNQDAEFALKFAVDDPDIEAQRFVAAPIHKRKAGAKTKHNNKTQYEQFKTYFLEYH
ncbi:MAG: hypothetical protein Q9191_005051, partial [Dirinaria sp. TL-2023a]